MIAYSETHPAVAREWDEQRRRSCSLGETLDFLRACHRRAPFLFFNGNTFADIGRRLATALFAELPAGRLREVTSSAKALKCRDGSSIANGTERLRLVAVVLARVNGLANHRDL
jgi:hypothetical protein